MAHERPILLEIPREFVGSRVILRPYDDADAQTLNTAVQESRDHLRPWLPWYNTHQTLDDTREFIRRSQAHYLLRESIPLGIFAREEGRFLGGVGLHIHNWQVPSFEIGYWLRASAEGQGYMSEAVRLLTSFAFDSLQAQRVVIRCNALNRRSRQVAERLGYQLEAHLRRVEVDTDGQYRDELVFAMIPEDFERARSSWPK